MRDGFSKPVVVLITLLFLLGLALALPWFFSSAWYTVSHGPGAAIAGRRFDTLSALRISAVLSRACCGHNKQEASCTTPLEFFFGLCFGFFLFILMLSGAGALFGG
jgi:hypothetical protein